MSTTFTLTPDIAIDEAIRMAGGQPSQFEELESARIKLNLLLTEWQIRGVNLWKLEYTSVAITSATAIVSLDPSIVDILDCVWNVSASDRDLGMERISYDKWLKLYNKTQEMDRPTSFLVERLKDQTNMRLWPVPNTDGALRFWAMKRTSDINNMNDSIDAPYRYLPALVNGLGYKLFKDRVTGSQEDMAKLNVLKQDYKEAWDMAYEEDRDRSSFKVVPKMK